MAKHLHIVACSPRSGTTLLHEVMVTCFAHDKHYDHEIRFNRVRPEGEGITITKRPKDTLYMLPILKAVPDFAVVYVLRDPRDVITSRHSKDKTRYYSNVRVWRDLHAAARQLFDQPNFLQVKYEDFVTEPDRVQQDIAGKFPWLESKHSFSEYHEHADVSDASAAAMHGVRPIDASSVGAWKEHSGRIKAQQDIHGSLTPDLIECGYEASGEWEKALDDVEPDMTRSFYPEKTNAISALMQRIDGRLKIRRYLASC